MAAKKPAEAQGNAQDPADETQTNPGEEQEQEQEQPPARDPGKQPVARKAKPPARAQAAEEEDEEPEQPAAKSKSQAKRIAAQREGDDTIEEIDEATYRDLQQRAGQVDTLTADLAKLQKQLKELQAKNKAYEDEKLTAEQKREQDFKETQNALAQTRADLRQARMESAVAAAAAKLTNGALDGELAISLVGKDITFDDDGQPQNIEQAIRAALQKWPALAGTPKPPTGNGSSQSRRDVKPDLTFEDIMEMSEEEIIARQDEVDAVLAGNTAAPRRNGSRR